MMNAPTDVPATSRIAAFSEPNSLQPTQPLSTSGPAATPEQRRTRRGGWSKTIINFWLDSALLVTFIALWWVSAVLQFLFPAGEAAHRWTLWGGSVVDWQNAQFVLLCLFSLGVLLHLMLHWSWIVGVVGTKFLGGKPDPDNGTHTLIGVGLLIALLHLVGIILLIAHTCMSRRG